MQTKMYKIGTVYCGIKTIWYKTQSIMAASCVVARFLSQRWDR